MRNKKQYYVVIMILLPILAVQVLPEGSLPYVDQIPLLQDQEGVVHKFIVRMSEPKPEPEETPLEEVSAEQLAKMIARENRRELLRIIKFICIIIFVISLIWMVAIGGQR